MDGHPFPQLTSKIVFRAPNYANNPAALSQLKPLSERLDDFVKGLSTALAPGILQSIADMRRQGSSEIQICSSIGLKLTPEEIAHYRSLHPRPQRQDSPPRQTTLIPPLQPPPHLQPSPDNPDSDNSESDDMDLGTPELKPQSTNFNEFEDSTRALQVPEVFSYELGKSSGSGSGRNEPNGTSNLTMQLRKKSVGVNVMKKSLTELERKREQLLRELQSIDTKVIELKTSIEEEMHDRAEIVEGMGDLVKQKHLEMGSGIVKPGVDVERVLSDSIRVPRGDFVVGNSSGGSSSEFTRPVEGLEVMDTPVIDETTLKKFEQVGGLPTSEIEQLSKLHDRIKSDTLLLDQLWDDEVELIDLVGQYVNYKSHGTVVIDGVVDVSGGGKLEFGGVKRKEEGDGEGKSKRTKVYEDGSGGVGSGSRKGEAGKSDPPTVPKRPVALPPPKKYTSEFDYVEGRITLDIPGIPRMTATSSSSTPQKPVQTAQQQTTSFSSPSSLNDEATRQREQRKEILRMRLEKEREERARAAERQREIFDANKYVSAYDAHIERQKEEAEIARQKEEAEIARQKQEAEIARQKQEAEAARQKEEDEIARVQNEQQEMRERMERFKLEREKREREEKADREKEKIERELRERLEKEREELEQRMRIAKEQEREEKELVERELREKEEREKARLEEELRVREKLENDLKERREREERERREREEMEKEEKEKMEREITERQKQEAREKELKEKIMRDRQLREQRIREQEELEKKRLAEKREQERLEFEKNLEREKKEMMEEAKRIVKMNEEREQLEKLEEELEAEEEKKKADEENGGDLLKQLRAKVESTRGTKAKTPTNPTRKDDSRIFEEGEIDPSPMVSPNGKGKELVVRNGQQPDPQPEQPPQQPSGNETFNNPMAQLMQLMQTQQMTTYAGLGAAMPNFGIGMVHPQALDPAVMMRAQMFQTLIAQQQAAYPQLAQQPFAQPQAFLPNPMNPMTNPTGLQMPVAGNFMGSPPQPQQAPNMMPNPNALQQQFAAAMHQNLMMNGMQNPMGVGMQGGQMGMPSVVGPTGGMAMGNNAGGMFGVLGNMGVPGVGNVQGRPGDFKDGVMYGQQGGNWGT